MIYAVRRYLHYSKDQWARLPWIEQHTYIEGLARDGLLKAETTADTTGSSMSFEALEATGATVRRL